MVNEQGLLLLLQLEDHFLSLPHLLLLSLQGYSQHLVVLLDTLQSSGGVGVNHWKTNMFGMLRTSLYNGMQLSFVIAIRQFKLR